MLHTIGQMLLEFLWYKNIDLLAYYWYILLFNYFLVGLENFFKYLSECWKIHVFKNLINLHSFTEVEQQYSKARQQNGSA